VVPSRAALRSDFILLERMMMNLVSNAVRYTAEGGVVIGCRRRGAWLRIDVCDSGPGIAEEDRETIFGEFVQLRPNHRHGGLGLGLSIVDRLGRLLAHPVEIRSVMGRGSRFSVTVPRAALPSAAAASLPGLSAIADPLRGKCIAVIDDDRLVLEGMGGVLRSWGCRVITARSAEEAVEKIRASSAAPDLLISDLRLAESETGIAAIEQLRAKLGAPIPGFLISGDTEPARVKEASAAGFHLLHKPVPPMRLRAILTRMLMAPDTPQAEEPRRIPAD
jgi:CheY-like chemotaxis protein